jgi:hypothetical protein
MNNGIPPRQFFHPSCSSSHKHLDQRCCDNRLNSPNMRA